MQREFSSPSDRFRILHMSSYFFVFGFFFFCPEKQFFFNEICTSAIPHLSFSSSLRLTELSALAQQFSFHPSEKKR